MSNWLLPELESLSGSNNANREIIDHLRFPLLERCPFLHQSEILPLLRCCLLEDVPHSREATAHPGTDRDKNRNVENRS